MSSELDINAIRDYLLQVGCRIEYPILVNAFKKYLYNPDPNVQGRVRTQFKDYVNRLATVSLEDNMKFINLRPEFRPEKPPDLVDGNPTKRTAQFAAPPFEPPPPVEFQTHGQSVAAVPRSPTTNERQTVPSSPKTPSLHPNRIIIKPQSPRVLNPINNLSQIPPPVPLHQTAIDGHRNQRPWSMSLSSSAQNLTTSQQQMPPPRPPPRRRQSTASLFKQSPKTTENSNEIHDLVRKSPGRVKEHASKLNSFTSTGDLHALMPAARNNTSKENRLSRESSIHHGSISSNLQRNGSCVTTRSRTSQREDESDSSSLQPIDPLRRRWAIEACNCNYNGLINLLREDPKLASYKEIVNGYTALHWAAKFGNLDIIKLIAGTHGVSANTRSSAGLTPLHIAYLFNHLDVAELLLKSYKANPEIRDYSGKKPTHYGQRGSDYAARGGKNNK